MRATRHKEIILIASGIVFSYAATIILMINGVQVQNTIYGIIITAVSLIPICTGLFMYSHRIKDTKSRLSKIVEIATIVIIIMFALLTVITIVKG